ncbi:MAG: dipicolinate synthase subunit B [Oscillospiraceae bacterium]|nr:dipicolinate synthase subunit B [Oscillospiraceae bacterium]
MKAEDIRVGFGLTGSYCTFSKALKAVEEVKKQFGVVLPILSENSACTDTRFGTAESHRVQLERVCGRTPITTIQQAEPIGPKQLLDVLVIAPCTGNTLGKLANGITDTTITMAAKAHLRNGRPLVLAVSTNDGLAVSLRNIGDLSMRKNIYLVPFGQDDPENKPTSLVADMTLIPQTIEAAMEGRQLQPLLLR